MSAHSLHPNGILPKWHGSPCCERRMWTNWHIQFAQQGAIALSLVVVEQCSSKLSRWWKLGTLEARCCFPNQFTAHIVPPKFKDAPSIALLLLLLVVVGKKLCLTSQRLFRVNSRTKGCLPVAVNTKEQKRSWYFVAFRGCGWQGWRRKEGKVDEGHWTDN